MNTVQGSSNPVVNAATMFVQSIYSPGSALTINIPPVSPMAKANKGRKPGEPIIVFDEVPKEKAPIIASSLFMSVVPIVTAITVLAVIATIGLAWLWPQPTPNEQIAFELMDFISKTGFGGLLGLLAGKNIR